MAQQNVENRFRTVGDGSGSMQEDLFFREEVQLALRNRGMPLEGLRYSITPTGMHYLLVHYDIPYVEPQSWKLDIGGLVSNSLALSLDDIKKRPSRTIAVTMECAGNGRALLKPRAISQPWLHEAIGTAEWTGTPLKGVLEEAGLRDQAREIVFTGLDQGVEGQQVQYYQRSLKIADATREEVLLAYEMNGQPLQPQHGYPLRLIVPGWYGMTSVKWLDRIEAVGQPFEGYQMNAYRYCEGADDLGERVTRIRVRSLMIPPGIPDFMTRTRLVPAGTVELKGRAWAGLLSVSRVEVSDDGGATWGEARLGQQVAPFAWQKWSYQWSARPGKYSLCVRATDSEGNVQPVEQPWNFRGMGNNMVHWVDVIVE
jgi:sulfane dehydrogenase subunit SoxC